MHLSWVLILSQGMWPAVKRLRATAMSRVVALSPWGGEVQAAQPLQRRSRHYAWTDHRTLDERDWSYLDLYELLKANS